MRISSYNPSDRYRQRALTRFKGAFVFVLMCVLIGGVGFWLGRFYEGQTSVALNNEVERLQAQHVEFESALTEANAQAQTAMTRYEELEATVSDVVTQGPMQELLVVLKAQLDNGVDEQRLLAAVRGTRPPENCSVPEIRRFVMKTPNYKGPESRIVLADGALAIYGSGQLSYNTRGAPQAWYDPLKPVTVRFEVEGKAAKVKRGVLPLYHSVVIDDKEYRLSVEAGAKSFASVRYDICDAL